MLRICSASNPVPGVCISMVTVSLAHAQQTFCRKYASRAPVCAAVPAFVHKVVDDSL